VTGNRLADIPAEATPPVFDREVIARLTAAIENLANHGPAVDPELKCYTPAEAAVLLGKTANWVVEAVQRRAIPFTYVGKSPRLTAAHIRQIASSGEQQPHKYAHGAARSPAV
jgi:hypothetical protein